MKTSTKRPNLVIPGMATSFNGLASVLLMVVMITANVLISHAQTFVHPGGLHNQADLDRMKTQVAAGAHPWIDDWNVLITDSQAQNTYTAAPLANMGGNRQRASRDAHAAYLNAIRWYISGDVSYADCAVRICNAWSSTVNQVPSGTDIPGLSGIPIFEFAMVGELLRIYPGWSATDFATFKNMMITYLYPVCNDFLVNHRGACISNYWANWDICNIGAIMTIGVLCDDAAKYNQAVTYFQSGAGMGSIANAVTFLHPGSLGQWQESGRDQEHAQLGVGMMGYFCEVAWNQGLDLFGYSSNRLMAGAEYVAKTNLWRYVPYQYYNNCVGANQSWVSINGRGRLDDRPVWELLYNHYVVRKGLSAPNIQAMAQLMRPEHGSIDHFGYGTLTFTQAAASSPYPPSAIAPVPTGLTATAGVGQVFLKWAPSNGATAQGYNVLRATTSGGPYTSIASWSNNTTALYTDASVTNGTTYYYVVAAINQSGTSANSAQASATPIAAGALPSGWARQDIGTVSATGSAAYATVSNGTFNVTGSGTGIGGTADSFGYAYQSVTGDFTITARLVSISGTLSKTGIMMRESLATNAMALVMKLGDTGWRQAGFGTRSSTGGSMTWAAGNDYTWTTAWFRLQRVGNVFTAFESSDGASWFTVGTSTVAMATTYYVGLAACSGSTTGALDTSVFDNVAVISGSAQPIPDGTYKIIARHSGKALDVTNNGTANGTNVQQWTLNGCNCQQWTLTNLGSGQYKIIGLSSGKSLDVAGVSTADGANVQIWTYNGGNNQRFTFTPTTGGYYRITPVHSGKALDVASGSTADGANVQQWTYNGGNNQQWQLVPATSVARVETATATPTVIANENDEQVIIYPNPATDEITVKLGHDFESGATLMFRDGNGRTLYSLQVKGAEHVLKLNKISVGYYFMDISNAKGSITKKLIKY
ncbi:MAG TPA: RICIN domain-containing protein [Cyclobacteriaceae bacterium]